MKVLATFVALSLLLVLGCAQGPTQSEPEEQTMGLDNGSFTAELNDFEIHYEVRGKGPVLMTVPNSWGLSLEGLRGMYRPLEEKVTMVYFDPRGMGASAAVREEPDMSMEAVRQDFDALRRHLGLETVNAIGWSNGAGNLVYLASEYPETLESAIFLHGLASYTAEDGQAFAAEHPELMAKFMALQQETTDPDMPVDEKTARLKKVWLEDFFPAACAAPETMAPLLLEVFGPAQFSWAHGDYTNRTVSVFDAREQLAAIATRSLVIAGTHDTMPIAKGEELATGIAGAELVVLESSGHFAPIEEPEVFRDLVWEFLGVGG